MCVLLQRLLQQCGAREEATDAAGELGTDRAKRIEMAIESAATMFAADSIVYEAARERLASAARSLSLVHASHRLGRGRVMPLCRVAPLDLEVVRKNDEVGARAF
jgi:hypothetical protein